MRVLSAPRRYNPGGSIPRISSLRRNVFICQYMAMRLGQRGNRKYRSNKRLTIRRALPKPGKEQGIVGTAANTTAGAGE